MSNHSPYRGSSDCNKARFRSLAESLDESSFPLWTYVCMYIKKYIYTHIYIYVYVYVYIYTHIYIHIDIQIRMYILECMTSLVRSWMEQRGAIGRSQIAY